MIYKYNKELVPYAQELRKNMTDEEKRLWYDFLKRLPVSVRRQKNIGNYIVDFFVPSHRIVIELDGSQHGKPENKEDDRKRDADMRQLGIRVLRYTNVEIHERFQGVCADILSYIGLTFDDLK